MTSKLLSGLNEEQTAAVLHTSGPLLIVAGAGTGKTTVITRKIVYLIEEGLAKPDEVLALTFTEKAAGEMEERITQLLPIGVYDLWVSTFHAFGERVLNQYALDIGLPNNFQLADDVKQWTLLYKNIDRLKLNYYRPTGNPTKFITALLSHISKCKDELITPEQYLKFAESLKLDKDNPDKGPVDELEEFKRLTEVANAYHTYEVLLRESELLDFGDLINCTLHLFQSRPNILKRFRKQFKFILVDEFQDTNYAQYELVKLLAGKEAGKGNIIVVGDDDQSIYKFRGASVSNIKAFKKDFAESKQITLTQNYRSGQDILDLSYAVVKHNDPDRLEVQLGINKKLINPTTPPSTIGVLQGSDLSGELDLVIQKCLAIHEQTNDPWNDFCILVRSNSASEEIIPKLEIAGIPFTYLANRGLYKKAIIADLIAYLRLLINLHDAEYFYRVLNFPIFAIVAEDIAKLSQNSMKKTLSLYEMIEQKELIEGLTKESIEKLRLLQNYLKSHSRLLGEKTAVEAFVLIITDLKLGEWLEKDTLENVQSREYLEQFYKKIEKFEQTSDNRVLRSFLETLELELKAGETGQLSFDPDAGPECLKLMTIHASKGLEFKHVFVVNMVDQRFPTRQKKDPIEIPDELIRDQLPSGDFHLQEERRLFYVAMTRAKTSLFFSWAPDYGGTRAKRPSIFLTEAGLVNKPAMNSKPKLEIAAYGHKFRNQIYKNIPESYSFSALNTFLKCPLEYKYRHYLKIPYKGAAALSFGITVHATLCEYLEDFHRRLNTPQLDLFGGAPVMVELGSLQKLLDLYEKNWVDEWYVSKMQKEEYRSKGKKLLEIFYQDALKEIPRPKYLEKSFRLKLGEYFFIGKIDRADFGKDGLKIIDYKTGMEPKKHTKDDVDQLRIYQWASEEALNEKVMEMQYWYLEGNTKKNVELSTPEEILEMQERLMETINKIVEAIKYDLFAELHNDSDLHQCHFEGWA